MSINVFHHVEDPERFTPRKLANKKTQEEWTYSYGGVGTKGQVYTMIQSPSFSITCASTAKGSVFYTDKKMIGKMSPAGKRRLPIQEKYYEPYQTAWFSGAVSSQAV